MLGGQRLVVEAMTMSARGSTTINLGVQVAGKARQRRATGADFAAAVKVALESLR